MSKGLPCSNLGKLCVDLCVEFTLCPLSILDEEAVTKGTKWLYGASVEVYKCTSVEGQ